VIKFTIFIIIIHSIQFMLETISFQMIYRSYSYLVKIHYQTKLGEWRKNLLKLIKWRLITNNLNF